MAIDTSKVLVGVSLVDSEMASLSARQTELAKKVDFHRVALAQTEAELTAVNEKAAEVAAMPSVQERAEKLIAGLEALGMTEAAIRSAVVAQFGVVKAASTKALKPPSAQPEKAITLTIPNETQEAILAAVREAGAGGVLMLDLYEKFAAKGDGTRDENLAAQVLGTVKNAMIQNDTHPATVRGEGMAKGKRYYAV